MIVNTEHSLALPSDYFKMRALFSCRDCLYYKSALILRLYALCSDSYNICKCVENFMSITISTFQHRTQYLTVYPIQYCMCVIHTYCTVPEDTCYQSKGIHVTYVSIVLFRLFIPVCQSINLSLLDLFPGKINTTTSHEAVNRFSTCRPIQQENAANTAPPVLAAWPPIRWTRQGAKRRRAWPYSTMKAALGRLGSATCNNKPSLNFTAP